MEQGFFFSYFPHLKPRYMLWSGAFYSLKKKYGTYPLRTQYLKVTLLVYCSSIVYKVLLHLKETKTRGYRSCNICKKNHVEFFSWWKCPSCFIKKLLSKYLNIYGPWPDGSGGQSNVPIHQVCGLSPQSEQSTNA